MRYVRRSYHHMSFDLVKIHHHLSTNETDLSKVISQVLETHKRLDGLVLNAGVLEPIGRISDSNIPLDAWKTHFDINFFSLVPAIRASIVALRASKGRVVFVSSGSAIGSTATWGPYNAAKAAMNSLCRYSQSVFLEPDLTPQQDIGF